MKTPALLSPLLLLPMAAHSAVVASYNFNTAGNTEGWAASSLNVSGLDASGGTLNGTASSNDPQLKQSGLSLTVGSGETWDEIIFRVRETEDVDNNPATNDLAGTVTFNAVGLVVVLNNTGALTFNSGFSAVDSGDGYFTVSLDISSVAAATTITELRIDPIGGASINSNSQTQGNLFEVDSIQVTSVPEPSTTLLGGTLLLGLALRRRR